MLLAMPAPTGASLRYSVSLSSDALPKLAKPPPLVVAVLADSVLLVSVIPPNDVLKIAPPRLAELLFNVVLSIVNDRVDPLVNSELL